jgi:alcohol dehydrogenase class IV
MTLGLAGIEQVRRLVASLPIPSLREIGATEQDVPRLTDQVMADAFELGVNAVPVERSDAQRILTTAIARQP